MVLLYIALYNVRQNPGC